MITREEIDIFRKTLATGATISTLIKMNKDVLAKAGISFIGCSR